MGQQFLNPVEAAGSEDNTMEASQRTKGSLQRDSTSVWLNTRWQLEMKSSKDISTESLLAVTPALHHSELKHRRKVVD